MAPDNDWFAAVYEALRKRRRVLPFVILGAAAVSVASLWIVPFDTTLDSMLPEGSEAQRMIRFLREASFADKVVVSLASRGTGAGDRAALADAADRLAASVGPPLISRVITDFAGGDIMDDVQFFARNAPQILDADDLAAVERGLAPEAVAATLQSRYAQLLRPEGLLMGASLRGDPLGIRARALEKLRRVSASFGYDVLPENNHLISRDGRHAMVIMETPVAITDGGGSRRLLDYLRGRLALLPASVAADVICGHAHTVSNQRVIQRDIAITDAVGSLVFIGLLLACFRQMRSVLLIFLIPVFAAAVALPLTALIVGRMALLVVGLGTVIAGIAVDYGMHVYVAARHSADTREAVRHVATPVFFGSLTTLALFASFFFSSIAGYHQLAWFSILSLLISIGCALFVLPHFVHPLADAGAARRGVGDGPFRSKRALVGITALWAATIVAGIPLALRVRFDPDITRLDGTDAATLKAEAEFRRIWERGGAGQAMLVAVGSDPAETLAAGDRLYRAAVAAIGADRVSGLPAIWPCAATRRENAARWQAFWSEERVGRLRERLAASGGRYGFASNAFEPFFAELAAGTAVGGNEPENALLDKLKARFVRTRNGRTQVTAFFADETAAVEAVTRLAARDPAAMVVSGKAIAGSLSRSFSREVVRISLVALVLIVGATLLLMRNLRVALIALVPPVTAVVWLLALMACLGATLNAATLIAGIVVFGLSVDYSFVMLHSHRHRLSGVTRFAVHLSAITTVAGTAVLLFARHPALFSMGVTLTIGVTAGYLAAVVAVPAMCDLFLRGGGEGGE